MTRTDALRNLLAAVEADDIDTLPDNCFRHAFAGMKTAGIGFNFSEAHEGSVDAAIAFVEAVLPGWGWEGGSLTQSATVYHPDYPGDDFEAPVYSGESDTTARAMLIAALKALIAQENQP